MEMSTPRPLSALLEDLKTALTGEKVQIERILEAFHERGFGILLFLFSLPAAVPIPMPGLNSVIAIPLILLTWQQMTGRHTVWMPGKIRTADIDRSLIEKTIDFSIPWVKRLEYFIKPRLGSVTQGAFSHLIGAAGLIMAVCGAIPLPFVNTVPAVGITLMAMGVLMRDGLVVLAGMIGGLLWVVGILAAYAIFGMAAAVMIKDFILAPFV
jgi:hypothetical protein